MLKTWPNCHNRFYSAGEDAIVRLWTIDKVLGVLMLVAVAATTFMIDVQKLPV